jgi:hypothetical protein
MLRIEALEFWRLIWREQRVVVTVAAVVAVVSQGNRLE